jgi:hypothetical protein
MLIGWLGSGPTGGNSEGRLGNGPFVIVERCWSDSLSVIHDNHRGFEGTIERIVTGEAWSTVWTIRSVILQFRQHHTGECHKSEEHLQNREQDIGLTYSSVLFVC